MHTVTIQFSTKTFTSFSQDTIQNIGIDLILQKNMQELEPILPFIKWKLTDTPSWSTFLSGKKNFSMLFFSTCTLEQFKNHLPKLIDAHRAQNPSDRDIPILASSIFGALLFKALPQVSPHAHQREEQLQKLLFFIDAVKATPFLEIIPKDKDSAHYYQVIEALHWHKETFTSGSINENTPLEPNLYAAPLRFTLMNILADVNSSALNQALFEYTSFVQYLQSVFDQKSLPANLLDNKNQAFIYESLLALSFHYLKKHQEEPLFAPSYQYVQYALSLEHPKQELLLQNMLPYIKRSVQKQMQAHSFNPYSHAKEQCAFLHQCLHKISNKNLAEQIGQSFYEAIFFQNQTLKHTHVLLSNLCSGDTLIEQLTLNFLDSYQQQKNNHGASPTEPLKAFVAHFSLNEQVNSLIKLPSFALQKQWLDAMLPSDKNMKHLLAYQKDRNGLDTSILMDLSAHPQLFDYALHLLEEHNLLDAALDERAWVVGKRKKGDVLAYCVAHGHIEACQSIQALRPKVNLAFASKAMEKIQKEDPYEVNPLKAQSAFDQLILNNQLEVFTQESKSQPPVRRHL